MPRLAAAAERSGPIPKEEAKYQETPRGILSCALCTQFVAPNACKVVIGKVSPDGWCALFDLVD